MKIGIYTPYLNSFGGGEKFICRMAEVLRETFDVEFIVPEEPNIPELKRRLGVNLNGVSMRELRIPKIPRFEWLIKTKMVSELTKDYDIFINMDNELEIPAHSPKNIRIIQAPPSPLKKLKYHNRFRKAVSEIFLDPYLRTYSMIIVYSHFVEKYVRMFYPRKNIKVLYCPVDIEYFHPSSKKENIILSVGRFFVGGNSKKQLEMIKTFKELYDENNALKKWEFHLVGGVSTNIGDLEYLKKCIKEAQGYPIYFHINAPFETLKTLYSKAKIFWHATGLHEDETRHPDRMEHFGITTGEAMAAGCVPVVINKGGQPEIVRNNVDGFLWNTLEELKKYTLTLINDELLWEKMSRSSIERSKDFSVSRFSERTKQIFTEMLENES